MATLIFVDHEGNERSVEASKGESVMEAAIKNSIPGIDADCGGACACATCHVYIDPAFMETVGKPEDMEQSMLDFAENVTENSRLSCQITVSDELNGLKVTTPESQH
ncbi:MAG: 2Fe-2S iron-sulfur cluster-binding protein [Henriciella sp.]|jgi:2Fe-2S ferredoxin|nr:2Fe-2S iron-sulfur cluster-binding protein [Henriciella sp.]